MSMGSKQVEWERNNGCQMECKRTRKSFGLSHPLALFLTRTSHTHTTNGSVIETVYEGNKNIQNDINKCV